MITTVIFDLDDTLYDELDFVRSGFLAVAQHLCPVSGGRSVEQVYAAMWNCFLTDRGGSTFDRTLGELGIPCEVAPVARLVEIYRTHRPKLTLPPESRRVLDELKGRYALALLTDGYLPTQKLKVQALDIEGYFQAVMYTEQLGRQYWKPSPVGFERLLETLAVRPEQAVYVGDNQAKDFIAPNRLGMLTIQLLRPSGLYRQPSTEPEAAPKRKIDKIHELPKILATYQTA